MGRLVGEGWGTRLTVKVTFKQKTEGGERETHADKWRAECSSRREESL